MTSTATLLPINSLLWVSFGRFDLQTCSRLGSPSSGSATTLFVFHLYGPCSFTVGGWDEDITSNPLPGGIFAKGGALLGEGTCSRISLGIPDTHYNPDT